MRWQVEFSHQLRWSHVSRFPSVGKNLSSFVRPPANIGCARPSPQITPAFCPLVHHLRVPRLLQRRPDELCANLILLGARM